MANMGLQMKDEEIDEMILEAEYDNDGYIQYENFVKQMHNH